MIFRHLLRYTSEMYRIIFVVLVLTVSACGGGGGSSTGDSNRPNVGGGTNAGSSSGESGGTTPTPNLAPVAELTSGPAKTGQAVQLDASGSSDPNQDLLTYSWALASKPSNSLLALISSNRSTTSIVPDVSGEYRVQVTVRDPFGQTSTKALTLNAQSDTNLAPVIRSFSAERSSLNAGEALGFNWAVIDPNGSPVSCTLDPTGGGSTVDLPGCASSPIATHTYDKPGVYQPRLTVTDNEGLSVTSILGGVTVLGDIGVTIVAPAAGAQITATSLPVTATITSAFEVSSVTARIASQTAPLVYSATAVCNRGSCSGGMVGTLSLGGLPAGEYVLEVRVEDARGSTAFFYRSISYGSFSPPSSDGDAPVIASFRASATSIFAGSPVSFYWLASDPQGGAVSCSLDPTGSGPLVSIPDCVVSVSSSYTFTTAGAYRPKLVATDSDGKTATAELSLTVSSDPTATLVSPATGAIVGSSLAIAATVTSSTEISRVVARVGDQQTTLTYSATAVCGRIGCSPGFAGNLDLSSLARGPQTLELAVTNIQDRTVSLFRDITYDRAPGVSVAAPGNDSVATPETNLAVTCSDDDTSCTLEVRVNSTVLASGTGSLSQALNLAAYDGQQVTLSITATDSRNQKTTVTRTLYVEASAALTPVVTLPGRIIDFDGTRVLYVIHEPNGEQAWVRDLSSSTTISVGLPDGKVVGRSFLSDTGAVLTTQDVAGNVLSSRIMDWNDGTLYDLASPNSAQSLVVSHDWAMWSQATTLIRRNLSDRTNTVISTQAGNWQNDLASDGTAVWWGSSAAGYQVYRDNGSMQQITNDALWNTYVLTDGNNIVYRKHSSCCSNQEYAITLFDGSIETTLRPASTSEPSPGIDYQVKDGWVTYTSFGNLGQKHVLTRSPERLLSQRTQFGRSSTIDRLGPAGEVMLISNGRRYLSRVGQELVEVGSSLGRAYYTGSWRVVLGTTVLELNP